MKYPQLVSMPSAVSDWLEEQLEARGIDAVVYTRYVLSLLYRDPVDIICPDQDLHITHPNKEVRRAGGGRKRFCRSSDYSHWGHADADRLKRSAAVECLKSASDQKCGIESLVDELCAKLKEIQGSNEVLDEESIPVVPAAVKQTTKAVRIPKKRDLERDSARRYYAAFPALSGSNSSSPKLALNLIPKWLNSPKRRSNSTCSSNLTKKHSQQRGVVVPGGAHSKSLDDKLRMRGSAKHADTVTVDMKAQARSVGKHRFNYFARNSNMSVVPNTSGVILNNNNKEKNKLQKQQQREAMHCNMYDFEVEAPEQQQEQLIEDEAMYDDLPVLGDIRDLLESPTPSPLLSMSMMNLANMTESYDGKNPGRNKFLPCGTNIISSIWSTSKDSTSPDLNVGLGLGLNHEFSNIRIDHSQRRSLWSDPQVIFNDWSPTYNAEFTRWSDGYEAQDDLIAKSLVKLNHNREGSCFAEVQPRCQSQIQGLTCQDQVKNVCSNVDDNAKAQDEITEDLLHSASSHFKPINEKSETKARVYADGTTFAIHANLDVVSYERSASGTMFLTEQSGCQKKYLEYKAAPAPTSGICLKFNVNQNDKGCQTDAGDLCLQSLGELDTEISDDEVYYVYCDDVAYDSELELRPDSMMAELFGKEHKCEQCCGGAGESNELSSWRQSQSIGGSNSTSSNIWNGEICMTCLRASDNSDLNGTFKVTPLEERQQLREDIKEDGEQLLSDLSSVQKSYMEQELDQHDQEHEILGLIDEMPVFEETCDIGALIDGDRTSRDVNVIGQSGNNAWRELRVKQNAGVPIHSASFSFATRLQQDCLLKMATIPTLRSVTL